MASPRRVGDEEPIKRRRRRATTTVQRENELMVLATDLAEKQLRDGTASAQVMTHYLKMATVREEIEREKLRSENKLLEARVESLASFSNGAELTRQAIEAFTSYKPEDLPDDFNVVG